MSLRAFRVRLVDTSSFILFSLVLLLLAPLTAWSSEPTDLSIDQTDPKAWVQLMSQKGLQVELDGFFTYERQSHSSSYHYIRQVVDGEDRQRLIFMDGNELEIIKEDGILRCLHPKKRVSHDLRSSEIKNILNVKKDFSNVWENYEGVLLEDIRIAGRLAKVIKLQPKDAYRFPYVFTIDAKRGVLLGMLVVDNKGHVLERFRYVTINFDDVSDAKFYHGVDNYKAVTVDMHQAEEYSPLKAKALSETAVLLSVDVAINWLPQGFVEKIKPVTVANRASLRVFSDGLSSFSVFIEQVNISLSEISGDNSISKVSGGTAVSARYVNSGEGTYQLTVIGELPLDSINKISKEITLK